MVHHGVSISLGRSEEGALNSGKPLRVACFLEGRSVPASRFRFEQYCATLQSSQDRVTFTSFYTRPGKYLSYPRWLRRTPLLYPYAAMQLLLVLATRLAQILLCARRYDVIVLQRDLLFRVQSPFLEQLLFWWVGSRCRFVFDIDDAIFLGSDGSPAPRMAKKVLSIAHRCHTIVAGNSFLAAFFAPHPDVRVIPTVIDLARYPEHARSGEDRETVIGWIGTAANLPYLAPLAAVLTTLSKMYRLRVVLVCEAHGTNPFASCSFASEIHPWSATEEISELQRFDIGLMPIPETDWGRGKCGFKLLQYMAAGVPAVASAVGVNCEIIQSGRNGFLARTNEDWLSALTVLLSNPTQRASIARAGRRTVEERYALSAWQELWLKAITGDHPEKAEPPIGR